MCEESGGLTFGKKVINGKTYRVTSVQEIRGGTVIEDLELDDGLDGPTITFSEMMPELCIVEMDFSNR